MAALRSGRPAGVAVSAWPSRGDGTRPFPRRSPRCSELAPSRGPILGASRNKGGAVMAERVFFLPDLGEGLEEAVVSAWLVAEGDEVELNQPFAEIETAKAGVEGPGPWAGR